MEPTERKAAKIIALVSILLLILHIGTRSYYGNLKEGLDAISVGLILILLSPWIARIIETVKFGNVELKFVKKELELQKSEIETLQFLVSRLVSTYELEHLKRLNSAAEFFIDTQNFPDDFKRELRHLRDLGLINNHPGTGINPLYKDEGQHKNLHKYFYITDAGKHYLKLHEEHLRKKAEGTT